MSNYTVGIDLGPLSMIIATGDDYDDEAPRYVLDGLTIGWNTNEGAPFPSIPNPATAQLRILVQDADDLAGVARDSGAFIRMLTLSGGTLFASIAGRVADISAVPVRRNGVQYLLYTIVVVDHVIAELAELPITLTRPAELGLPRLAAIEAAILAAGGPALITTNVNTPSLGWDALNVTAVPALTLLRDHLSQCNFSFGGSGDPYSLPSIIPATTAGVLTAINCNTDTASVQAETWPPGKFQTTGGLLKVTFGHANPVALGGRGVGLTVDAGKVPEAVSYRQVKGTTPNTITITGAFGSVTYTTRGATDRKRELVIASTVQNPSDALLMAVKYALAADINDWRLEAFTWYPTDAELQALTFSLTPNSETVTRLATACYRTQVVVNRIPNKINPSGNSGLYAGTPNAISVAITRAKVAVTMRLNHRLPGDIIGGSPVLPTWDEVETNIGTGVKWNIGAAKVDPNLTWYETRLARKF